MCVLLADRLAGLETLAETLLQDAEHGCDAGFVAFDCIEVAESHGFLRVWTIRGLVVRLGMRSVTQRRGLSSACAK